MMHIDINCDIGEGIGNEELLVPFISSANIACGFHASDENEMKRMVALCLQYGVAIGAHPSFPDRENFGRAAMNLTAQKIQQLIKEQLKALNKIVLAAGGRMHHVKPHGALYNMAAKDTLLAMSVAEAVKDFDDSLIYYGLSGSVMIDEAVESGLRIAHEAFADRTYQPDGSLTPRTYPGSLITDAGQVIAQVMQMIDKKMVTATNGEHISIQADTICIHGDGSNAVEFLKKINDSLLAGGILIKKIE
ncbi:MAG: 5-oxoprolinase subunit PxpA [Ferruginibacter sp.]